MHVQTKGYGTLAEEWAAFAGLLAPQGISRSSDGVVTYPEEVYYQHSTETWNYA